MNLNRLRPTDVKREDLDVWLSGVVNDAIRDAAEAGLDTTSIYYLLKTFTETNHPIGYRYRSHDMARKIKPATMFDVRALDNKYKGTLVISDFGEASGEPEFMATLAAPPFAAPPGFRTESAAVRAVGEQVRAVLDQLTAIADNLDRNGR